MVAVVVLLAAAWATAAAVEDAESDQISSSNVSSTSSMSFENISHTILLLLRMINQRIMGKKTIFCHIKKLSHANIVSGLTAL